MKHFPPDWLSECGNPEPLLCVTNYLAAHGGDVAEGVTGDWALINFWIVFGYNNQVYHHSSLTVCNNCFKERIIWMERLSVNITLLGYIHKSLGKQVIIKTKQADNSY